MRYGRPKHGEKMRVLHYKRVVSSGWHIHAFSSAICCYVPDRNVVLYREQLGSFGGEVISITADDHMLREARIMNKEIANEKISSDVKISDVQAGELDDKFVDQAIEIMRTEKDLRERITKMSETLLPKE